MDSIDLGSAPWNEECASVGDDDYGTRARRECRALIGQLKRVCGQPSPSVRFRVAANPHDFGTYYSVVVEYDGDDASAAAYAQQCDEATPEEWDGEARLELGLAGNQHAFCVR